MSIKLPVDTVLISGLIIFGVVFAINTSLHSFLTVSYANEDGVSLDVGYGQRNWPLDRDVIIRLDLPKRRPCSLLVGNERLYFISRTLLTHPMGKIPDRRAHLQKLSLLSPTLNTCFE